MSEES
jgi:hypothetical protein